MKKLTLIVLLFLISTPIFNRCAISVRASAFAAELKRVEDAILWWDDPAIKRYHKTLRLQILKKIKCTN